MATFSNAAASGVSQNPSQSNTSGQSTANSGLRRRESSALRGSVNGEAREPGAYAKPTKAS